MKTSNVIGAFHFLPLIGYGDYTEDEIYETALLGLASLEVGVLMPLSSNSPINLVAGALRLRYCVRYGKLLRNSTYSKV